MIKKLLIFVMKMMLNYIFQLINFTDGNFPFIKSAGYTVAFNFLHYKNWVLLNESDVILNENFGYILRKIYLN